MPREAAEPAAPDRAPLPGWTLWGAIVAGWVLLTLLLAPEVYLHFLVAGRPVPWDLAATLALTNTAVVVLFSPLIVQVSRRSPLERGIWPRSLGLHAVGCLAFSLAHVAVYWALCHASGGALGELFFQRFHPNLVTYWGIVGFVEAVRNFARYRQRDQQLAEARLKLLKTQLQPHFLFNALNTIAGMMHKDVAAADRMLTRLSDLLRLALQDLGRDETTLGHELEFAEAYFEIQRARFGPLLRLEKDVAPGLRAAVVPSFLLQPLVENAILHGFPSGPRRGRVRIEARAEARSLVLLVVDDGCGLPREREPRAGLGLGITRLRLQELYGALQRLTLDPVPTGGARVTLELPLRFAPEEEPEPLTESAGGAS